MNIFKKLIKEAKELDDAMSAVCGTNAEPKPEEEWIWVEGYKGTDRNMQCRGYQFELGVQHDIPDDQEIVECKTGFHLCKCLDDVFCYYSVGWGNRFFKVRALVRKTDYDNYRGALRFNNGATYRLGNGDNKLVSRSIILQSELTIDEILKYTNAEQLPIAYKQLAINGNGIEFAVNLYQRNTLVADGYSEVFAQYIVQNNLYDTAHAFGSQKDLSMDVKVLGILYDTIGGSK